MANIKSQIKRNRQNLVRHERNKAVRSELKTRAKAAVAAAEAGEDDAETKLREAVKPHRQRSGQGRDPQEPGGAAQGPASRPGQRGGRRAQRRTDRP